MENQQSANPIQVIQTTPSEQKKTNILIPILLTFLISGIVFGLGGYYLGTQSNNIFHQNLSNEITPLVTNMPETSPTQLAVKTSITPTSVSLTTYTSSFEKLSFKYPADWQITQSQKADSLNGDSMTIQSPSGKVEVNWIATLDGLGGGCNETAVLGSLEGCPLITIVEKQKLTNADLYYVAYLNTPDGVNFYPGMALLDSTGTLTTRRGMGYMLFKGKNNGGAAVKLGVAPVAKNTMGEPDAKAFFMTPEVIQAKNILLSASY